MPRKPKPRTRQNKIEPMKISREPSQNQAIVDALDALEAWLHTQEDSSDALIEAAGEFVKQRIRFAWVVWKPIAWALDKMMPEGLIWILRRVLQKQGVYPDNRRILWPGDKNL